MKVIIVTFDEPFYIPYYLDNIFRKLPKSAEVIKVYALHPRLSNKTYVQTVKEYFSFYGVIIFSYLILLRLFYAVSDVLNQYLNMSNESHSVKLICEKYKISYSSTHKINAHEVLSELKSFCPDVIFSVGSPQIFKQELISIPSRGCLNIHSSLLPKYRGQNANFWVMAKGEETTGVSVHYINPGIDDGDILLQEKIRIENDWSLHDLYMKAIEVGSGMIAASLQKIYAGNVTVTKNDISKGSYYSFPTAKDVKEFRSRKRKFFKYH